MPSLRADSSSSLINASSFRGGMQSLRAQFSSYLEGAEEEGKEEGEEGEEGKKKHLSSPIAPLAPLLGTITPASEVRTRRMHCFLPPTSDSPLLPSLSSSLPFDSFLLLLTGACDHPTLPSIHTTNTLPSLLPPSLPPFFPLLTSPPPLSGASGCPMLLMMALRT